MFTSVEFRSVSAPSARLSHFCPTGLRLTQPHWKLEVPVFHTESLQRFVDAGVKRQHWRLDEPGHALAQEIRAAGGSASFWHLDVASESAVISVFHAVHEQFGGIDVLVNNAGIAGVNKPTHEITEEEWDHLMAVNVKGVFFCTKHAIPYMKTRAGGSIINLSSIYGIVGAADLPPYHASKGAVRLMSKNDALLYAADRIRVNSIHPGFIWTPLVETFAGEQGEVAEIRKQLDAKHPIGHVGEPDDIGWGIVYLASDESKFVTGSELVIDGGYTAR